jgi:hypothetical protein
MDLENAESSIQKLLGRISSGEDRPITHKDLKVMRDASRYYVNFIGDFVGQYMALGFLAN